jgi:hypothetical protein
MGVLTSCKPRKEVLKGDLDDAIFAADFGELIDRTAPPVYRDPKLFFQNTHPAAPLCSIARRVFERLANPKEAGTFLRLSTGFGGGKTHTLMAFWHLAKNIGDPSLGTELVPAAGRPKKVTVVGVDASKAGVPDFSLRGKAVIQSLWGELFYQLGGKDAWSKLGKADHPEASPPEKLIEKLMPSGPVLILLDEIVIYMARLSDQGQGNLLGFLGSLVSVVVGRPQTVLVVTAPGGQAAYARYSDEMAQAIFEAAPGLDESMGRKATDFDPIGKESARVIVRRLFASVDSAAAQAASATYRELYDRVLRDNPGLLPVDAASASYAQKIVESYPFHPRLLQTATDRLGAMQDFQKSRGVLRLFARIVRDVWDSKQDHELITAGEIDWKSQRIQADLLNRLDRSNFMAAVSADVEKHAGELDGENPRGIHRRVASALLLESIPLSDTTGLDSANATLAVLRPDEAGSEPAEALDRLVGVCWHTYPMLGGRGWQFRYQPNIIKQIEERKADVSIEDGRSRVLAEAQEYFAGPTFKVAAWPDSARQVRELSELQLALCEDEKTARAVCAFADDSDPQAPIPRGFQNAILAVTATPAALSAAVERARRLMAAEEIERENKTGEAAKLVREQLQRIKPELQKQFRIQTCRAFDRVVLADGGSYPLDEQFQVPEEQLLKRPQGQVSVMNFLKAKALVYEPGDALDVGRFLKDVLPGTTPTTGDSLVYAARAIHERFLGAPKLRLIPDPGVVRQTIIKAVSAHKLVVKLADGRAYDTDGYVEGPENRRRRVAGTLTSLPLEESTLVTTAGSPAAKMWLAVDDSRVATPQPLTVVPKPGEARVVASTWDRVAEYAKERPLLQLKLTASAPADGAALAGLAQPLGADSLNLSVSVGGPLKDGGTMSFSASEVKPSHPMKPLEIAQRVFGALAEGAAYEAQLSLDFGEAGRLGLDAQLEEMARSAPEGVSPWAQFDRVAGGEK